VQVQSKQECVAGAQLKLKRAQLVVTEEEAEQLAAYLTELREVRARLNGEKPNQRRAVVIQPTSMAERFVRSLPPLTLRMWRTSFECLHGTPALASAGTMLIDELERAYGYLERRG
jgi:hypothetical protein